MALEETTVTIDVGGAKVIINKDVLFRTWLEKYFGNTPAASGSELSTPFLNDGEEYAGIIFGKNGAPNHRLILLPGEATDVSWADAISFAKDVGGDLPTRREQSLLYTNLKEQFKEAWYWSSEQHSGTSNGAWGQVFSLGDQDSNR